MTKWNPEKRVAWWLSYANLFQLLTLPSILENGKSKLYANFWVFHVSTMLENGIKGGGKTGKLSFSYFCDAADRSANKNACLQTSAARLHLRCCGFWRCCSNVVKWLNFQRIKCTSLSCSPSHPCLPCLPWKVLVGSAPRRCLLDRSTRWSLSPCTYCSPVRIQMYCFYSLIWHRFQSSTSILETQFNSRIPQILWLPGKCPRSCV